MIFLRLICMFAFSLPIVNSTIWLPVYGNRLFGSIRPGVARYFHPATASRAWVTHERVPLVPPFITVGIEGGEPVDIPITDPNSLVFDMSIWDQSDALGVDWGSDVANTLDGLILIPRNYDIRIDGLNIIRRQVNYTSICAFDQPVFVSVQVGDPETPSTIRARFSFGNEDMEQSYSNYSIDSTAPSNMDAIPIVAFQRFESALNSLGIVISDEHTVDCTMRHLMPEISYTIANHNDEEMVRMILTPDDYVREIENGFTCMLMIRPTYSASYLLGPNFMQNAVVIFDYANEQVGFCEPRFS